MLREVTTGSVVVKVTLPENAPEVAVITAEPGAIDFAMPDVAPIVAIAGALELQVTVLVMSLVVASLYVPVAVNC